MTAHGPRGNRKARRNRRVTAPAHNDQRTDALRSIATSLTRIDDEQQIRLTSIEIATAMRELVHSNLLGLTDEQKEIGDRATVAYCTWWLEQRGLDQQGRRLSTDEPPQNPEG